MTVSHWGNEEVVVVLEILLSRILKSVTRGLEIRLMGGQKGQNLSWAKVVLESYHWEKKY